MRSYFNLYQTNHSVGKRVPKIALNTTKKFRNLVWNETYTEKGNVEGTGTSKRKRMDLLLQIYITQNLPWKTGTKVRGLRSEGV